MKKTISTLTACSVLLMVCVGCARWAELTDVPPGTEGVSQPRLTAADRVPAMLRDIRVTQNGASLAPSLDFERLVLGHLDQAYVFSYLIHTAYAQPPGEKHVKVRLSLTETVDPHAGANALRGLVIGASMFLLTSVLPFEYDYESQMVLEMERWDGRTRQYTASFKGTAYFHLFGATPLVTTELKGTVRTACLDSLMTQLAGDVNFYAANQVASLNPSLTSKSR